MRYDSLHARRLAAIKPHGIKKITLIRLKKYVVMHSIQEDVNWQRDTLNLR